MRNLSVVHKNDFSVYAIGDSAYHAAWYLGLNSQITLNRGRPELDIFQYQDELKKEFRFINGVNPDSPREGDIT